MPSAQSTVSPPPVGSTIDDGSLELVEILGYGGYGVVYRAVDLRARGAPKSYAVKCLTHVQSARQRQLHMREITLHRLASAHQNVVTVHRVVEDAHFTFIVMDYCADGDLFSQILHQRKYLGYDRLIKHVFLQLLDAVEHCHSLGVYHRDIKPENVLCLDGGLRVALTDFGLATTDKVSQEFRTGSVYHMSPECQGGRFAPTGSYSPLFNDIWSLGIVLLNLATGRNPWKSATLSDPTFYAYLQSPGHFLPTVLPISDELNELLVRTLEVDWRKRITLKELRRGVRAIDNFYSDDVVFENSMARCPWEAGVDLEADSEESEPQPPELPAQEEKPAAKAAKVVAAAATPDVEAEAAVEPEADVQPEAAPEKEAAQLESSWSTDSDSAMVFAAASEGADAASWIEFDATPSTAGKSLADELDGSGQWVRYSSDESDFEPTLSVGVEAKRQVSWDAESRARSQSSSPAAWIVDGDGDRSMSPSPSPSWIRNAFDYPQSSSCSTYSTPSSPRESVSSLPPTPRVSDSLFPPSSHLASSKSQSLLTIDTTCCRASYYDGPDPYDGDSSMFSARSSEMQTAVESWGGDAGSVAPWSDSFFLGDPSKPSLHAASAVDIAMAHDEDADENDEYIDADALGFGYPPLTPSSVAARPFPFSTATTTATTSGSGSGRGSDTSLGNDADVEDADMDAFGTPFGSPTTRSVKAQAPFARIFFPPPSAADPLSALPLPITLAALDPAPIPLSPAAGKSREGKAGRRGSSRFNPIKLALRSLSPSASRSRSRSGSRSRSKWDQAGQAQGQAQGWAMPALPFLAAADTASAPATPGPGIALELKAAGATFASAVEAARPARGLRSRATKRSWFTPRKRLFATAACAA